jgi:hypothetical protein
MTFSQKSDVKKHLARPTKKSHYLPPVWAEATAEQTVEDTARGTGDSRTPLDDKGAILVAVKQR